MNSVKGRKCLFWVTVLVFSVLVVVLSGERLMAQVTLDEAASLNQQVTQLYQAGRYREAISLAERALAIREKALGPEHPEVAQSLNNLAILYDTLGDYGRAEPLYERALAIREKALGPKHPEVATSLNNLAVLYYAQGDYGRAEPLYRRALAIREKALGPEHPDVATDLNNLAVLYYAQGDYGRAEPLLQRALAIREKALGPEHPEVATSLTSLAVLYHAQGDYGRAEPLYQRALAIDEKALGPEHPEVATNLNNLAALYYAQGDYGRAEPLYERALATREKALGPEHPEVATSLNNLAVLYHAQGDYGRAEPLYERALATREKALGPEHPDVAQSLNNLAELYRALGDYGRAEPLYQRALAIREKALGPEHPDVAQSLNNLAILYDTLGDYGRAEPLYERALATREKALGPEHPDVATHLNNLAALYDSLGDYGRAELLYRRALAIDEKALGPNHPDVAGTKGNLGFLYLAQGKLEEAYQVFKEEKGSSGLGRYSLLKGDYQVAQEQFSKALEYSKKIRESVHLLAAYIGLGLALEGLRQDRAAAEAYQQAVTLMEEQRAALAPAARTHFLEGKVGAGFKRILAYKGLVRVSAALQDPATSVFWAENTKARLLLEALGSRASGEWLGLPEALARQEADLSTRIAATYKQQEIAVGQKNAKRQQEVEQELAKLKQEQTALTARLRREYPAYAAIRYPQPLHVTELKLKPEEVLLEYEVTEKETFAWLIKGQQVVKALTIPVTRAKLTEQVKRYRSFFEGITHYDQLARFDPQIGKELYDILFKEFPPLLKEGEHLVIVPDEILGILPFETLVMDMPATVERGAGKYGPYPQGVKYLGDVYPLSYAQSATALALARTLKKAAQGKQEKLLVVADPVFDVADARLGEEKGQLAQRDDYQLGLMRAVEDYQKGTQAGVPLFPRLENTGQLPAQLQQSYGKGVEVLWGLAASEAELRKRPLPAYTALIFATHGILDDQVPYIKEPALVLSQVGVNGKEPEQDGFLTMSEVMGLSLNAEIAALTACNTGVGKNLTGEGVMGMGRAFQYAGAKTVLMSLWSVAEESTTLLTERFFTHVHEGKGKLEALRLARADVRKAGYEHPFFWAPFILVGER